MIIFVFLGMIASLFQLVILREFTFSIAKNELAFVAAVGFWLISCSLGSIFRAKKNLNYLSLPYFICLIFCLSISAIHLVKSFFGINYYEAAGFGFVFLSGVMLISPTAFIIGCCFTHFSRENLKGSSQDKKIYAKFFAFEAIGFFLGSAAFTFLLADYSNPFIFSFLALLLLPALKERRRKLSAAIVIICLCLAFIAGFNPILGKEFKGSRILRNFGSRYGPVILARKNSVESVFSAGSLIATSEDKLWNEEFIHMSLSAAEAEKRKNILFIGAGISGQLEEIAKHNVNTLDCLQINPVISGLAGMRLPKNLKLGVNFIVDDPRIFLKDTVKRYDAVLMSMPAPANFALNRYYTKEFFALINSRLAENGIFSFHIPSKREILSPQIARFNSSVINALDKVFTKRLLIPADAMIIIAANTQKLKPDYLLENYAKTNIKTDFFTLYHFRDYLNPLILSYTEKMLDKTAEANTDLMPAGFLNYLLLEQIKFYPDLRIDLKRARRFISIAVPLAVILILILSFLSKNASLLINIGLTGFSSIGLNSIIFVLFQFYSGALFWKVGLLVALFMAGLSTGAFLLNLIMERINFRSVLITRLYLFWAFLYLSLLLGLNKIGNSYYVDFIFYVYSFICGILTGSAYPLFSRYLLKNKFNEKDIPAFIYAADLAGAFLGALASVIILLPFLGVSYCLLVLLCLNLVLALRNLAG